MMKLRRPHTKKISPTTRTPEKGKMEFPTPENPKLRKHEYPITRNFENSGKAP
jgi:hypothetical protein